MTRTDFLARRASPVLTAQLAIAAVAMVAALFGEARGGASMLVPLGSTSAAAWATDHNALLLGRGALPGALIVKLPSDGYGLIALRAGVLLVPVNAAACTDRTT